VRGRGPPPPPTAADVPDIEHELRMMESEVNDDPEYVFALAYVKTGVPAVAYRVAFDDADGDDKKAWVLGTAVLNSPNVQVFIAEIYEKIGRRLEITDNVLKAKLWQILNAPGVSAKEAPKVVEALSKIIKPSTDDDDRSSHGHQPVVNVLITQAPGSGDTSVRLVGPGDASVPVMMDPVAAEEDSVPLPRIE